MEGGMLCRRWKANKQKCPNQTAQETPDFSSGFSVPGFEQLRNSEDKKGENKSDIDTWALRDMS